MDETENRASGTARIRSLDGLRGIACVAVLLLHIGIMLQPLGPDADYLLLPGTPAVMVFYVLSGVVLSLVPFKRLAEGRSYDWFGYFPRRVIRLCIPLAVAIALGVVSGFFANLLGAAGRTAESIRFDSGTPALFHDILMQFDILFNVSDDACTIYGEPLLRVNSPVWSMSWELWFSLALPLAVFIVLKIKRPWAATAALFALIFLSHFSGYFPLRFCLMFILGVILAKHAQKLTAFKPNVVAEVAATLACILLIELPALIDGEGITGAVIATLMNAACMGLVALCMMDGLVRRLLSMRLCNALGTVSYSLYLTHVLVIGVIEVLFARFAIDALAASTLAIILSLAIAWLFWYLIERPSMNLSHKVKDETAHPRG